MRFSNRIFNVQRRKKRRTTPQEPSSKLWKNVDFLCRNDQKWLEQKNEIRRMTPSSMSVLVMTSLSSQHQQVAAAMNWCGQWRRRDLGSRPVMVDRSNGFDVDDESFPICLARCASGWDKSLTGLLERGIENGQEESRNVPQRHILVNLNRLFFNMIVCAIVV